MLNVVGFYGKKKSSLWREACQCEKKPMEKLCCLFFMHVEPGGPKGVSAILDRKTRFMPALRRFRGQMSLSFPPEADVTRRAGLTRLRALLTVLLDLHEPASGREMNPGGLDRRCTPGAAISR